MAAEDPLELGGGDLEALDLDQLLQPVAQDEVAVVAEVAEVAGLEPARRPRA
jgi:hypothetical protein